MVRLSRVLVTGGAGFIGSHLVDRLLAEGFEFWVLGPGHMTEDNSSSEFPLTFSFSNVSFSGNQSAVGGLTINGVQFSVDKSVLWDAVNSGYFYQLFMELWIYDPASDGFSFHNRFVSRWLNVTASV